MADIALDNGLLMGYYRGPAVGSLGSQFTSLSRLGHLPLGLLLPS